MGKLGRLLVIWGVLLPLLALPTTGEWGPGTVVIFGIWRGAAPGTTVSAAWRRDPRHRRWPGPGKTSAAAAWS